MELLYVGHDIPTKNEVNRSLHFPFNSKHLLGSHPFPPLQLQVTRTPLLWNLPFFNFPFLNSHWSLATKLLFIRGFVWIRRWWCISAYEAICSTWNLGCVSWVCDSSFAFINHCMILIWHVPFFLLGNLVRDFLCYEHMVWSIFSSLLMQDS